jgi:hypothetical protein
MQVTETLSSGLKREYKVVVNAAELGKELDTKLHELAGRANIKGFRPGGAAVCTAVRQGPWPKWCRNHDDQSKQVLAGGSEAAYQPEVVPEEEK